MEGGLHAASYGPDADAPIFQLSCDAHAHTATLIFYGASDEAETTMTLIAPDGRRDLVARSGSVLGRRAIVAHRRADDASIAALAASQDGFAIEAGGEVVRLPGDAMLARVIGACAAP